MIKVFKYFDHRVFCFIYVKEIDPYVNKIWKLINVRLIYIKINI